MKRLLRRVIGALDMLIAAHALSLNLPLATNNVKEFSRVLGLKVLNWTAPRCPLFSNKRVLGRKKISLISKPSVKSKKANQISVVNEVIKGDKELAKTLTWRSLIRVCP